MLRNVDVLFFNLPTSPEALKIATEICEGSAQIQQRLLIVGINAGEQITEKFDLLHRKAEEAGRGVNKLKSDFFVNKSHEMRTLLTGIIGYIELLIEEYLERGEKEKITDLQHISDSAKELLGLFIVVLEISKSETSKSTQIGNVEYIQTELLSNTQGNHSI